MSCVVTDVSREWFGDRRPLASRKASPNSLDSSIDWGICTMHDVCIYAMHVYMHVCLCMYEYILASSKASPNTLLIGGFAPCMYAYMQCTYACIDLNIYWPLARPLFIVHHWSVQDYQLGDLHQACMHICNAYVQCMYRYIFEEAIGLSQGLS